MNIQAPVIESAECSQSVDPKSLVYIPLKPNSKEPVHTDWKSNPVDLEWLDENPEYNVGVVLGDHYGNNIVDIDLDHSTAIKLAPRFLPETGMKFGRKSAQDSYWIYSVIDAGATKQFKHRNHGMIVEYRANKAQTVFPPSTHDETGEKIEYSLNEQPHDITRDELLGAVRKIAGASLLALNWNVGSRHDCALALSGALLRSGWNADEVSYFIEAICHGADDNEKSDRLKSVETTEKRIAANESVTGWKKLGELIGDDAAHKVAEWLDVEFTEHTAPSIAPSFEDLNNAPESQTDIGNAKRFTRRNADSCFYHADKDKWFQWNGRVWVKTSSIEISELAQDTATEMVAEKDQDHNQMRWSRGSCSKPKLSAMVDLSRPYLSKSTSELNNGLYLFNCQNGTLDLKTGKLHPHNRSDCLTQIANVSFDPEAECPRFIKFMNEICNGDDEQVKYIQTVLGYSLTGETKEQKMFIIVGDGANGKGTLIEVVKSIMGNYASTAQADTLMQKAKASGGDASPDIARLVDTRAVFLAEGDRSHKLNEAQVKQLTGQDTVTTRELYKGHFEFQPKFKLIFSTNYLPKVRGTDDGIWRRLIPIPFNVSFKDKQMDKNLRDILLTEKSGILNWLLKGCSRWIQEGLVEPDVIKNMTASYKTDSDNVLRFLESMTIKEENSSVPKAKLYESYKSWVEDEGEQYTASNREFSQIVGKQPHIEDGRTSSARCWKGIKLNSIIYPSAKYR